MIALHSRTGGPSNLGRLAKIRSYRSRRRSVGSGHVRSKAAAQSHAFNHVGALDWDLASDRTDFALQTWQRFHLRRCLGAIAVQVRLSGRPDGRSPCRP